MKRLVILVLLINAFLFVLIAGGILAYSHMRSIYPPANLTPTPLLKKDLDANTLWSLIQKWRTNNGFQPYTKDQRLCDIASDRVSSLPHDHSGFEKEYSNSPYVLSENIVWDYPNEQASLNGWLGSPPHRKALESNYKYSCIACKQSECIQIFSSFKTDKNNPY